MQALLGPLGTGGEIPDRPGAHQVDAQLERPVDGGEEEPLAAPACAPAKRLPSSSRSGGSNVFSVAMCAGPAC